MVKEGALLLLCRLLGHRPVFAPDAMESTAKCWSFSGANRAPPGSLVVFGCLLLHIFLMISLVTCSMLSNWSRDEWG